MNLDAIPIGNKPPEDINIVIEVPIGGEPIKYELDKAARALFVESLPAYTDAVPWKLRLRAAHAIRRRRPD